MTRFFGPVLVCLALALCACGPAGTASHDRPASVSPDESYVRRRAVLVVDSDYGDVFIRAAELFAAKVEQYTAGAFSVEVRPTAGAAQEFTSGRAQLSFLDGRESSNISLDFVTLSAPMRYKDYKTYSMALNSAQMNEALNDRMKDQGIRLLGAFYTGSNYLLADRPTVDGEFMEDPDQPFTAVVRPDSGIAPVLNAYGMQTAADSSFSHRLQQLLEDTVSLVEFSPEELTLTSWTGEFYLYSTNHSIAPRWLAMDERLYSELSPAFQAAVMEACAYLFPLIDEHYLRVEGEAVAELGAQGVNISKRFGGLRETAAALEAARLQQDARGRYLTGVIAGMA